MHWHTHFYSTHRPIHTHTHTVHTFPFLFFHILYLRLGVLCLH
jgi:hypothetical protein